MANNNKLLVPGAENALDQMKNEIANEFGVTSGRIPRHGRTDQWVARWSNE